MSCLYSRRSWAVGRTFFAACAVLASLNAASLRAADFTIGATFSGTTQLEGATLGSNAIPAMPMGAAGPSQLVEFTSSTFATYSKDGLLLQRVGHRQFWQQALAAAGNLSQVTFPSSTRVLYDRPSNRFYAVAIDNRGTSVNNLLIAVTTGADASLHNWRAFSRDTNSLPNLDSINVPQIGINRDALYIGGNLYPPGLSTPLYNLYGVPLASLTAPVPSIQGMRVEERIDLNDIGRQFQPVVDLDGDSGALPGIAAFHPDYRKRTIIPAGWLSGAENIPVQDFPTDFAALTIVGADRLSSQPGPLQVLTGGTEFSGGVVKQSGRLWAVHEVSIGGRDGLRWYEFGDSGGQFTIEQSGEIVSPSLSYYQPSIAVNQFGDVVIGFSGSSANTPISTFVAVGRTQDGLTAFADPVMTRLGTGAYNQTIPGEDSVRWG